MSRFGQVLDLDMEIFRKIGLGPLGFCFLPLGEQIFPSVQLLTRQWPPHIAGPMRGMRAFSTWTGSIENPVDLLTSQGRCSSNEKSTRQGFLGAWVRSSKSVPFSICRWHGPRPCIFQSTVLRPNLSSRGALSSRGVNFAPTCMAGAIRVKFDAGCIHPGHGLALRPEPWPTHLYRDWERKLSLILRTSSCKDRGSLEYG